MDAQWRQVELKINQVTAEPGIFSKVDLFPPLSLFFFLWTTCLLTSPLTVISTAQRGITFPDV